MAAMRIGSERSSTTRSRATGELTSLIYGAPQTGPLARPRTVPGVIVTQADAALGARHAIGARRSSIRRSGSTGFVK